jgi:hypothetical protein
MCVSIHMPLTVYRVAALNGHEDRILSEGMMIKKGDVIESVNGQDITKLGNAKDAVAIVRINLQKHGEAKLKVLAARVFDSTYDQGVQGFVDVANFYPLSSSFHKDEDSPWERFHANIRVAGWSNRVAYMLAAFRLIFWHWLQPTVYWLMIYTYYDTLKGHNDDNLQLHLALAVSAREAAYFPITLLGLVYNPSFLLIDLTFRHDHTLHSDKADSSSGAVGPLLWLSYGFTPEKLVLTVSRLQVQ